jgi:PAS domain S-box-containing protein
MVVSVKISLKINKTVNQETKRKWSVITSLMILFLLGYSAFLYLQLQSMEKYLEIITGIVFLGGALFVLMVLGLIQNTLLLMNTASGALENEMQEHKLLSNKLKQSKATMDSIFNSAIPICITGKDFEIIQANKAFHDIFGNSAQSIDRQKCFESHPSDDCKSDNCHLPRILQGETEVVGDMIKYDIKGHERTFIVTSRPFLNAQKEIIGIVQSFQDITDRRLIEDANKNLIKKLQNAFDEVNTLSGLLPICFSCKNIRDDKGYWNKIESYIRSHSKVEFSHGICPDCAQELYPEFYNGVIEKNN